MITPLELSPSGLEIYSAEVEASETTAFRRRRKLANMVVDDVETAKFIVRAVNCHADLLAACEAALQGIDAAEIGDRVPIAVFKLRAAITKARDEK